MASGGGFYPEECVELMETGQQNEPTTPNGTKIEASEIEAVFRAGNFRRGFSMVDENKDGLIDIRELKRMISKFGNSVPYDVANKVLKMSDEDNDGYLNYSEFVNMLKNPQINVLFTRYLQKYVHVLVPPRRVAKKVAPRAPMRQFSTVTDAVDEPDGLFEEQYSCCPPPIAMLIFSIIQIILFSIDAFHYDTITGTGPMGIALMYDPHKRYEAWRYVSYMFVHIGYMHIGTNLFVQLLLGIPLEMVHHNWRIIIIYLFGVVSGSLVTSVADPNVYLAGASGGVYSLITAHIASVIMNWKEMMAPYLQLLIFVLVVVCDFGTALYNRYYLKLKNNIGYEAHLAGAFAGLLIGIFVLRNLKINSCEKKLSIIAMITSVILLAIFIIWNIAFPSYFPPQY